MRKLLPILLALLLLAGCKVDADIRPDTIVDIPLEPTQPVTEAHTEATEPATEEPTEPPTEEPTEIPTEAPTRAPAKKSSSGSSSRKSTGSSSKKNSGSSSKKNNTSKKETTPKATEAPTQAPTEAPTEPPTEAPTDPVVTSYAPDALDKAVIAAINAQRTAAGLPELATGGKLSTAAGQRASDLSVTWNRTRPDGSDFSTVLVEFGCGFSTAAQNLYYTTGSADADALVAQWMNADEQRAHILSASFTAIGVANYSADGVTYVAALFIG